eukprot:scaffold181179_cov47-Prasinocladus_malaysianus.AAC.1
MLHSDNVGAALSVRCRGRVVKAADLKSAGFIPRRFKSCRHRTIDPRMSVASPHLIRASGPHLFSIVCNPIQMVLKRCNTDLTLANLRVMTDFINEPFACIWNNYQAH